MYWLKFIIYGINHQSHQNEYSHLEFQNLLPFFEPLYSLMVVHRNRVLYPLDYRDDLNNYLLHNCEQNQQNHHLLHH